MEKHFTLFSTVALALILLTVSACKKKEDDGKTDPPPTDHAHVMFTHASPDAPAVDIIVDTTIQSPAALAYPNSTAYLEVNTGTRNITINETGTTNNLINTTLTLEKDKNYSVFTVDSASGIWFMSIQDDLSTPDSGKAHIRFLNLIPATTQYDLTNGSTVLFAQNDFGDHSPFKPVDAGTYNLELRVAGTSITAYFLPPITLEDRKIYTVFAKGFTNGSGVQARGLQVITNK